MEAEEVIRGLQNELAMERAKNAVLLEKLLELEDGAAESRLSEFEDVIPNEDREFWRGQFLENGAKASEFLGRLRNRMKPAEAAAPAGEVPGAKVPAAGAAKVAPRPMHNRAAAPFPKAAPVNADTAEHEKEVAAKIRNRAQEIANRDRISFTAAFARAEREFSE